MPPPPPSANVAAVVRAYNEDPDVLLQNLRGLCRALASGSAWRVHAILVDDGSDPPVRPAAEALAGFGLRVTLLRHDVNLGAGAALETGFEYVRRRCDDADWIVTYDPDGQHDPADFPALLREAAARAPDPRTERFAVFGSRFLGASPDIPRRRRWLLRLARPLVNLLYGYRLTDVHNGARVFTRAAVETIRLTAADFSYASELLDRMRYGGVRVAEHPVTVRYTDYSLRKGQKDLNALSILKDMVLRKLVP